MEPGWTRGKSPSGSQNWSPSAPALGSGSASSLLATPKVQATGSGSPPPRCATTVPERADGPGHSRSPVVQRTLAELAIGTLYSPLGSSSRPGGSGFESRWRRQIRPRPRINARSKPTANARIVPVRPAAASASATTRRAEYNEVRRRGVHCIPGAPYRPRGGAGMPWRYPGVDRAWTR